MKRFAALLICFSAFAAAAVPAVRNFSVARYLGKWHEVARYPNWFEKGMTNVTAEYTLLPDGKIRVVNSGWKRGRFRQITGTAKYNGFPDRGRFLISFVPPFYHEYRIILLNPDYTYAVVVNGNGRKLWILSRQREMAPETWQEIFRFMKHHGFDPEKLIF